MFLMLDLCQIVLIPDHGVAKRAELIEADLLVLAVLPPSIG